MTPLKHRRYRPSPFQPLSTAVTADLPSPEQPIRIRCSVSHGSEVHLLEEHSNPATTPIGASDLHERESASALASPASAQLLFEASAVPEKDASSDSTHGPGSPAQAPNAAPPSIFSRTVTASRALAAAAASTSRRFAALARANPVFLALGLVLLAVVGLEVKIMAELREFYAAKHGCTFGFLAYPDAYAVLGLPAPPAGNLSWYGATLAPTTAGTLAAARRRAARCWHPDKAVLHRLNGATAATIWARYEAAAEMLSFAEAWYVKQPRSLRPGLRVTRRADRESETDAFRAGWWDLAAAMERAGDGRLPECAGMGSGEPGIGAVLWGVVKWYLVPGGVAQSQVGGGAVGGLSGDAISEEDPVRLLQLAVELGSQRYEYIETLRVKREAYLRNPWGPGRRPPPKRVRVFGEDGDGWVKLFTTLTHAVLTGAQELARHGVDWRIWH